jgi:hypothetical protein
MLRRQMPTFIVVLALADVLPAVAPSLQVPMSDHQQSQCRITSNPKSSLGGADLSCTQIVALLQAGWRAPSGQWQISKAHHGRQFQPPWQQRLQRRVQLARRTPLVVRVPEDIRSMPARLATLWLKLEGVELCGGICVDRRTLLR